MRKSYWIALGLVLVLALGVFAAACGTTTTTTTGKATTTTAGGGSTTTAVSESTTTTVANTTPLLFGVALSLTGASNGPCGQIKEGIETEVKYINDNGGIKGRQIKIVYEDDQSQMSTAMAAITKLIDDHCDVIIGPFPEWTNGPARQLTEAAGVFHIGFGPPTDEDLAEVTAGTAKYVTSFLENCGADGEADAWVKEMTADGKKNVLGVGDQINIHQEGLKRLEKLLPAAGIQYTYEGDSWSLDEADITPYAQKIADMVKKVNPDALICANNPPQANHMIKLLKDLGVTVPIYGSGAGSHPLVMFAPAGNDPANVAGDFSIGPAIVDPSQVPDDYPAKKDLNDFVARWKAGTGANEPFASMFLGFAYDAIHLAEQAITNATGDTPQDWAAAMEAVDWWGAAGHYQYSAADHLGIHAGFFQWQYTNGQGFKLVRDLNGMPGEEVPQT